MVQKQSLALDLSTISSTMWAEVAPLVRENCERSAYEGWVRSWLERVDNEAWAKTGLEALALPGTQLEDYCERALQIGTYHFVVGIRFLGGKGGMPFVDFNLTDAPQSRVPWSALGALAGETYRAFTPQKLRRLRWLSSAEANTVPGWAIDQVLLAGPLKDLQADAQTQAAIFFRELALDEVGLAARRITEMYTEWLAAEPWMRGYVMAQTETSLRESVEEGLALVMEHQGRIHGVISCKHKPSFRTGCAGLCVQEKVVSLECAGRGWSKSLHAEFVKHVRQRFAASTLLYGTVDARNKRSLANAEHAGRKPIACLEFTPLVA